MKQNEHFIFLWYKRSLNCHFYDSEENLRAALGKMGVGSRAMEDVMDKVRNRHYQVIEFAIDLTYTLT